MKDKEKKTAGQKTGANEIVFKGLTILAESTDKKLCICSPDNCSCTCMYPTNIASTRNGVSDGRSTVMYNQNCIG